MVIFRYSILFLKFLLLSYHFDNTCLAYAFACRMVRVFVLKSQYVTHLMRERPINIINEVEKMMWCILNLLGMVLNRIWVKSRTHKSIGRSCNKNPTRMTIMIIGYSLDPRFSISILLFVCMNFKIAIDAQILQILSSVRFSNTQKVQPNMEVVENF